MSSDHTDSVAAPSGVEIRPPTPRRATVRRERLLSKLAGRFDRRLTVVRAGAGFGKTTLLSQALEENDLDPRGQDIWLDLEETEVTNYGLCPLILGVAQGQQPPDAGSVGDVVSAIWQRAPAQVTIVLDNVHRVADIDGIGEVLESLVREVPVNGHVLLSSRVEPPFAFRRMIASGDALLIDETELAFDADDLSVFAGLRNVAGDELGSTGWPALLELRAAVGVQGEREYVAEEVLTALGPERLRAIQQLAPLGWLDDALVEDATDFVGTAAELVEGLPLTSHTDDGRIVLHDLWRRWLPPLTPANNRAANARLGQVMNERGELPTAFGLYAQADEFELAEGVLRAIALDYGLHHSLAARRELLVSMPTQLVGTAAAQMVEADVAFISHPQTSAGSLALARTAAHAAGDAELEAHAILRSSELIYQSANKAELTDMVGELEQLEHLDPTAVGGVKGLVEIWRAMSTNQMELASTIARSAKLMAYAPTASHARYYSGLVVSHTGHARDALNRLAAVQPQLSGRHAARAGGLESILHFYLGEMDDDRRAAVVRLIESIEAAGHTHLLVEGASTVAIYHLAAGDVDTANHLLERARKASVNLSDDSWGRIILALAEAALATMNGDEDAAVALIDSVMPTGGPFDGIPRHLFYNLPALTYVLSPQSRPTWDADVVGREFELARNVGQALVALRESGDTKRAASLPWSDLHRIRTWALEPQLAELAIAAIVHGDGQAELAIKELRHDPHGSLQTVCDRHTGAIARKANELLARTPRQPTSVTEVNVLGPMRLRIGDAVVTASTIRKRVVELLQLLIDQRTVTRSTVLEVLWPDLETRKARNNLRVTLAYLVKTLEPDRDSSAPPWHIRSEGDVISLVPSPFLLLDVDTFTTTLIEARRQDRSGVPSRALDGYSAACAMYGGEYLTETVDLDVGYNDRTRLRLDFVAAATRCAHLMTASGRALEAIDLAKRAIAAESLDEGGYIALLSALDALDRTRELQIASAECRAAFAEAELTPTPELERCLSPQ